MANRYRNEMEITIAGRKCVLRGSFEGLIEIEAQAGIGIYGILAKIFKSTLGVKEVVAVIYGGLVGAGDRSLTVQQVFELCQAHGFVGLIGPCGDFLKIALEGDKKTEQNEAASEVAGPVEKNG